MRFLKEVIVRHVRSRPLRMTVGDGSSTAKSDNTEFDNETFKNHESRDEYVVDSDSDSEWLLTESANQNLQKRNLLFGRSSSLIEIDGDWLKAVYKSGLYDFLKSNAGGSNSNQTAKDTCNRLSTFISWVLKNILKLDDLSHNHSNVLLTVLELIVKNPQNLGYYMDYLTKRNVSPSTKLTVLCQLKKCSLWSILYCPTGITVDQNCFDKICRNIYRALSKENRIRIQDRGNLDNLIKLRRWPTGGYPELRAHVLNGGCDFMDNLLVSINSGEALKSSDYCKLIRVLASLMYVTSHQGRPNALKRLRLVNSLLRHTIYLNL